MGIQPQISPGFTLVNLSLCDINSWQQDGFFRSSTSVISLMVNSAALLRMRLAHLHNSCPWLYKVTNSSVSCISPWKVLAMVFSVLSFSSWISPLGKHHHTYQEKDVLMIYCHGYRFAGLLGTLQCLKFYFTKMTPDISALQSIKHTSLIQALLMLSLDYFLVQKFKTEVAEFKLLKPEAFVSIHEGQCFTVSSSLKTLHFWKFWNCFC